MRQEMPDADEMKHIQGKRKGYWAPIPPPRVRRQNGAAPCCMSMHSLAVSPNRYLNRQPLYPRSPRPWPRRRH